MGRSSWELRRLGVEVLTQILAHLRLAQVGLQGSHRHLALGGSQLLEKADNDLGAAAHGGHEGQQAGLADELARQLFRARHVQGLEERGDHVAGRHARAELAEAPPHGLQDHRAVLRSAMPQDGLHDISTELVGNQAVNILQQLRLHVGDLTRAAMLDQPLHDAAAVLVPRGVTDGRRGELFDHELHGLRPERHDHLLQHMIRMRAAGGLEGVPM
mmetsp:Transcript_36204/g.72078  ORF Transcript_36204/g.72078 Transcript_36204/m.72078 type:complete len:215 (+) Transcript_36204:417-1061(+)